jgi:hypothetical protein
MMYFFIWVVWFFLIFRIAVDIFRDDTLGGWGKTGWLVLILVVPFVGILIYLIARGHDMGARDAAQQQASQDAFKTYVQQAAASAPADTVGQLHKLSELHDKGVLTDSEFAAQKAKVLA